MPESTLDFLRRWAQTPLPQTEHFYAGAITVPLFPTMNQAQQDTILGALLASN